MKPRYYQPELAAATGFVTVDIGIFGATSAGFSAALQASRMGKKVVILEAGGHLGGMTTGGLSRTDSGRKHLVGGIAREVYRAFGKPYGREEEWLFEPRVARRVFEEWLRDAGVPVYFHQYLKAVRKEGERLTEVVTESGLRLAAKIFIDASYEGDLMAAAGASFTTGREGNRRYGELYNGSFVSLHHQFDRHVDPYVVPGDPSSGLLPGIEAGPLTSPAEPDHRIQAYNFRLCVTREASNRIPFEKPEGYDPMEYELLARFFQKGWEEHFMRFDPIAGHKVDMNNYGPVSTDYIGGNFGWPQGSYAEREAIFQDHVRYQKGLLWFRCHDPRVPKEAREALNAWGLAKDEFSETGGWPPQLYIREARRLLAEVVMTDHHCLGIEAVDDPVAVASYQMDSHNCRRFVQNGRVLNEGDVQVRVRPYGISYRSIVPLRREVGNLLVPVCLAASHIAYGSIRMEPVFMVLGQSAATAAVLAIDHRVALHDLPFEELRAQLEKDGQVLDPSA
ncbi:MAG TPA: FAD-dependent oxidoreductase [Chthoniobacteraceae bacterium]|nr:FAD-dependent oxidoreductase [Chthoniobacteraceae bacterium]